MPLQPSRQPAHLLLPGPQTRGPHLTPKLQARPHATRCQPRGAVKRRRASVKNHERPRKDCNYTATPRRARLGDAPPHRRARAAPHTGTL